MIIRDLPKDIQELAYIRHLEGTHTYPCSREEFLNQFLSCMFVYAETPEGHQYWEDLEDSKVPSPKSPQVESFLSKLSGDSRQQAATELRCIAPPVGCGKPITGFRDPLSAKEHRISGLCQKCQDSFFGEEE